MKIRGIGPVLAAVFVAEIGDVTRFKTADALACWTGITPREHASDRTVRRGHISKEGCALVRWAAVEAVQRQCAHADVARLEYDEQLTHLVNLEYGLTHGHRVAEAVAR